jgi:hypothetical protein
MSANPSKSELCYLTKKPVNKGGLSFLAKVFTNNYNSAKVGILTKNKLLGEEHGLERTTKHHQ